MAIYINLINTNEQGVIVTRNNKVITALLSNGRTAELGEFEFTQIKDTVARNVAAELFQEVGYGITAANISVENRIYQHSIGVDKVEDFYAALYKEEYIPSVDGLKVDGQVLIGFNSYLQRSPADSWQRITIPSKEEVLAYFDEKVNH